MGKAVHVCPSFYKLLKEDDFRKEIRIPNAFMRDFKNEISTKCVLKNATSTKNSWPVRICRKHNDYYICKRAWPNFVKDHKLKYGDCLFFRLVNKLTFKVFHYGANCVQKIEVSCYEDSDSSSSSSDDDFDSFNEDDTDEDEEDGDNTANEDDDIAPSKKHSAKNEKKLNLEKTLRKSKPWRNSGVQVKEENEGEREEILTDDMDGHYGTNLENPYFIIQVKPSYC